MPNDDSGARIQTGTASDSLTAPTVEQRATHTPGPWGVRESQHGGGIIERAANWREHAQSHVQIVPLADAYLMAAAPDLLAACMELREALAGAMCVLFVSELADAFIAEMTRIGIRDGIGVRADAAIAKAEGR